MKIWLYDDYSGWGRKLLPVALGRGHDARLFLDPTHPDEGHVFVRLHHHPDVRSRDKRAVAYMAQRPELILIPDYRSSVLYDDKAEQQRQLARWMPKTAIFYSPGAADRALARIGLPLMSKCAEGAGSYNVRLIRTRDEAMREVSVAFSEGLPAHYRQRQEGYLLWQQFLPGNDYDFRVIAAGRERLILRRGNRSESDPRASGSNKEMPIVWPDAEASEVLDFANRFFEEERFSWCGIDVVKDREAGEWRVLETTTGWPTGNNAAHKTVSGRNWGEFWQIIVEEIEAGAFE